jgi:pimeloyl-ACP methyl ester carboxylesterase
VARGRSWCSPTGCSARREQQAELSSHLASWGYTVATPTLCTSAAWNIDQEKNGADLAELAEAVRPGPVVFVGHSAGGLASIVAGDVDPDAVGVVSLDGVEARGIAAGHAPGYPVPVYGLVGGPGPCNANNNFDDLYPSFDADVVRVAESDHCDFEAPTDWLCTSSWICAATDPVNFTGDDVKSTIFALATAAVAAASGDDRVADAWWASDGQYASPLYDAGAISPL